jgi:carbon storage regulator CsrA
MLVLSRKASEQITIFCGDKKIELTLLSVSGSHARIGLHADNDVRILRSELQLKGETNESNKAN